MILTLAACGGAGASPVASPSSPEAPIPSVLAEDAFSRPADQPELLGVNYHPLWDGMDQSRRSAVLDEVQASGVEWIRLDIGWHNIQPWGPDSFDWDGGVATIDQSIREATERGLRILLTFYWAPEWATGTSDKNGRPRDPQQYADAAAWVAQRYDGTSHPDMRIDAIELWNEPDLNRFWSVEPQATRISDFAALIRVGGAAVKAANPGLTVVTGGLSGLDPAWLHTFYQADPGMGRSYDILGLHAYPDPGDAPPDRVTAVPAHSLPSITAMGEVMSEVGDKSDIWITEFGWSAHGNSPGTEGWERGVTEDEQADYLLSGLEVLAREPRVAAAFWFSIYNPPLGDEHQDGFGLLTSELARRPSFYALRCAATGRCEGPR